MSAPEAGLDVCSMSAATSCYAADLATTSDAIKGREGAAQAAAAALEGALTDVAMAAPAPGLSRKEVCRICCGMMHNSTKKCPYLEYLPTELAAEIMDLCGRSQRNYALTLIQRCWERSGKWPPEVPTVAHVRGSLYCCCCDSLEHSAGHCPRLRHVDQATRNRLTAAYKFGSCNGVRPAEIVRAWEDGHGPTGMPPCIVCNSSHCFEACPWGHVKQEDFERIVSALEAGQLQVAEEAWQSVKAAKQDSSGNKSCKLRRRSRRAASAANLLNTDAKPSDCSLLGGSHAHGSQGQHAAQRADRPDPGSAAVSVQQQPQQQQPPLPCASQSALDTRTSVALGIPVAAYMHCRESEAPRLMLVPSISLVSSSIPPAACDPDNIFQQQHQRGEAMPLSHLGGKSTSRAAISPQVLPASDTDSRQKQQEQGRRGEAVRMSSTNPRSAIHVEQSSISRSMPLQQVLAQLQMPERGQQRSRAGAEKRHIYHPDSQSQLEPQPKASVDSAPDVPAADDRLPAPGPMQQQRPWPQDLLEGSNGEHEGSREPLKQTTPKKAEHCMDGHTILQNRQSSNSLAANPAFSRSNLKPAPRMKPEVSWVATPFKSPPSARSTASAAAAQEQQQQQQQPNARRHKETSAKAPVQDPWKGPLPTAVRVPPQPPGHPRTPSQPEAVTARPQPEPRSTSSQAVPPAKQQPMPPSKESRKKHAAGTVKQAAKGVSSSHDAETQAVMAPGPRLQNESSENNCFMNVMLQCLWHCTPFRDALLSLSWKVIQADEALRELALLFDSFGEQTAANRFLDPSRLRLALAKQYPQRFPKGEMSDAAEVLDAVMERLDRVEQGKTMARGVLGCHILEEWQCPTCRRTACRRELCQHIFTASAEGLLEQGTAMQQGHEGDQAPVMASAVIRALEGQTNFRTCDTAEGGCGRTSPMQQHLKGQQPSALALQLAWGFQVDGGQIRETLKIIQQGMDLGELYSGVEPGKKRYDLSTMVCFYGKHFSAFVHKDGQWWSFSDTAGEAVGNWAQLIKMCEVGRKQPAVLFFQPI